MHLRELSLTVLVANPTPDLYGASRMALESIIGFRDQGWRVLVVLPDRGPMHDHIAATGADIRICRTPVLRKSYLTPLGAVRLLSIAVRSLRPIVRLIRSSRPDVLYVNTITDPIWLLVARLLRIPVVCHVHEAESHASKSMWRALTAPLQLANCLLVNSHFTSDVLARGWQRLAKRSIVILNGVAGPDGFPPLRDNLETPIRLLYVGRISERKGVQDAIEATELLRRRGVLADLDVVGAVFPGYELVEEQLHEQVERLDVAEHVRFHGFQADVWPHLTHADILLVPSRLDDSFGNTAIEGVLAGRPVITSSVPGLLEAGTGFKSVLAVKPSSPEELAAAVEHVTEHWQEFRSFADHARGLANERHAPARYRAEVASVMASIADRRRTS